MSVYKFKDFTSTLNVKNNRYYYQCSGNDHCIHANFSENDNVYTIIALIEHMHNNEALSLLEESDYRWDGTTIIFKEKNHAAIFYIYCL